ncbi:MAG TPA: DciA family protein [Burkholderiaceae bacterium]|nr:DciA family protein [Burkholderiaceae bacterium]
MPPPSRLKPSASRPALAWLRTEPVFARLGEQASRIAAVQADLLETMPGLAVTVIAFEQDTLVVGARHAAVAARVRQLEPTLLAALRRRGWKLDRIRFKPQWQAPPAAPVRRVKDSPGADAVARLEELSEQVGEGRLRAALRRMAARHGTGPRGDAEG